ncbi:MAG: trigger factor [Rhodocyclaceae bacterium]|jgi:trigger factor|nr:trigger factor [Rhodocyclaceae bacterium]
METTQDTTTPQTTPEAAKPNPLERRIDMAVAMTEIEQEVEQQLKKIAKTTKMAGFRPGKVPMKMVAQMYGGQARSEALGAAIEKAFGAAVREQNLRVAGQPRIEPKEAADKGQMAFTAIFEVFPEFKIADVASSKIEKPVLKIGDAEVDKTIEVLRKQRTTYAAAARASEKGDRLVIDFTGRRDGEIFDGGSATDYAVAVGGGAMIPDFDTAMEGVTAGQEKVFDATFPADYHAVDLAGSTVQFTILVKSVEAPQLPAVDAEFARALGIADGDTDKMRAEVRANLEREVAKRLRARVKEQAMNALLETNPIDVPTAMVDVEAQQMADNARRDLESRGAQMKNIPVNASWFTEQAAKRVRLGLIVAELVAEKDLHVQPADVRAVVDDFAATFEDPKEVVRWYYSQPQRLAEAEALAMENNVVDWVLANAQVSDKVVAFDELMGNAA